MSSGNSLTAASLTQGLHFNWVFLVELFVCGVLTIFFLFYFNRLFAAVVSYGVRAWTWHRYRIHVDFQALQFSLLGGRLFFKGFRYHGNNETILIQSGYITWSYWLRRVRELDFGERNELKGKRTYNDSDSDRPMPDEANLADKRHHIIGERAKLPCRLSLNLKGLEWFVYNRSPAYDAILAATLKQDGDAESVAIRVRDVEKTETSQGQDSQSRTDRLRWRRGPQTDKSTGQTNRFITEEEKDTGFPEPISQDASPTSDYNSENFDDRIKTIVEENPLLSILPIHVECSKAAVVLGNEYTKSVFITKVEKLSGDIDATSCPSPDLYRQLINFNLDHPVIQIKPNEDYKRDQASSTALNKGPQEQTHIKKPAHHGTLLHRFRRKGLHQLQRLIPQLRRSVESLSSISGQDAAVHSQNDKRWQGLSRYLDENEQDDKGRWASIEYATVSTILDSPSASISYYWDIPGNVAGDTPSSGAEIGHSSAPAWGLDILLNGATINYGPWADRQRGDLQKVFFPSLFTNASVPKVLRNGQPRVATQFKLYVQLDEETVLRVPIREQSKNWKWKQQADTMGEGPDNAHDRKPRQKDKKKSEKSKPGPEIRPFGWLDVKVEPNATISYNMDMVARPHGFTNSLNLDLPGMEITTSVNHGLLWRSVAQQIKCDLSAPLTWNELRAWKFEITNSGLELFILREHIFLLIDLVDDWSSGPLPEYLTFIPFKYLLNLEFGQFRIYLNANDSNIINNPSDFDDNTFVVIFGTNLLADLCIPLENFRPKRNDISFDVKAHTGGLNLHVPPWNTQATFLKSTELAVLKDLEVSGRYQYCDTTAASNTDTLLMDVYARSLQVQLYGFLIRYFLTLKENYFGDAIHFKTLEEHQQYLQVLVDDPTHDPLEAKPHTTSNDLDVILGARVDDVRASLPSQLYSVQNSIQIDLAGLMFDLRFTNYYMDMQLHLDPLVFALGTKQESHYTAAKTSSSQLFIDGLEIFGHRTFGLPPSEPTYVCNWDFSLGSITGECSTEFVTCLMAGGKAFAFTFDDEENALPTAVTRPVYDITFLRANIESIRVWLLVDEFAFLLSTSAIQVNFDDWSRSHISSRAKVQISDIVFSCIDVESALRHKIRRQHQVRTLAYFSTSAEVLLHGRKADFENMQRVQQLHIQREDTRTHRADFLLLDHLDHRENESSKLLLEVTHPPAMCCPDLPRPLTLDQAFRLKNLRKKRSFLDSTLSYQNSFISLAGISQQSARGMIQPESSASAHRSLSNANRPLEPHNQRPAETPVSALPDNRDSLSEVRRTSFYSMIGDNVEVKDTPVSTMAFSSNYLPPYFRLEGINPDLTNVPSTGGTNVNAVAAKQEGDDTDRLSQIFDKSTAYTLICMRLKREISLYCEASTIEAAARLMECTQPEMQEELLDVVQLKAMTAALDHKQPSRPTEQHTQFLFDVPVIRVRFSNRTDRKAASNVGLELDQYTILIQNLSLASQIGSQLKKRELNYHDLPKTLILHVRIRSFGVEAREAPASSDEAYAAISGMAEDIVFWTVMDKRKLSANMRFETVDFITARRKIENLASLLERTQRLVDDTSNRFGNIAVVQTNRVRLFTYLVAVRGSQAAEPLFLTKPSYVLRSAEFHLRTSDSWKIVARLRYMFSEMDDETKREIELQCNNRDTTCPLDARKQVMSAFDQWRSWDLRDTADCAFANSVFGKAPYDLETPMDDTETRKMEFEPILSSHVSVDVSAFKAVLDPGPKQNCVLIKNVAASVTSRTSLDETGEHATSVTTYCEEASIDLNWDLCEVVQDILSFYGATSGDDIETDKPPAMPVDKQMSRRKRLQVVLVVEKGSISVETINIRAISISEGLKSSIILIQHEPNRTVSVMLAAEAATSKIRGHSQELIITQVRKPSIYTSYEDEDIDGVNNRTWKTAANAQELSCIVRQDLLALLEITDLLIRDEFAQLITLSQSIPERPSTKLEDLEGSHFRAVSRINVALFLDMYHISFPLMQSLVYNISGVIARASLSARLDSDLVFDFDIKENAHDFQALGKRSRSISLLQIPPTNGRITCHFGGGKNLLTVFSSVELIQFDAEALHSLLATLNRLEISTVAADMKRSIQDVQRHYVDAIGRGNDRVMVSQASTKPLIYTAQIIFAGLNIHVETTGGLAEDKTARLAFTIGCIQVEATNQLSSENSVSNFPEMSLRVQNVTFEMTRLTQKSIEACGNFAFNLQLTATSKIGLKGDELRSFHIKSDALDVNLFAETASTVIYVLVHLQDRIKDLDLSREVDYFRNLRKSTPKIAVGQSDDASQYSQSTSDLFGAMYSLELSRVQVTWITGHLPNLPGLQLEDLVLSLKRIELSTKKANAARLTIEDLQLQLVPHLSDKFERSQNSALLPQVVFNVAYVSTQDARRLAFQAVGKPLDLRLTPQFVRPAVGLKKSIEIAVENIRKAAESWIATPTPVVAGEGEVKRRPFFGQKRMESLLVDADFAGAVVHFQNKRTRNKSSLSGALLGTRLPTNGRYGQFSQDDASTSTVLRAPGLAWKIEFKDNGLVDPSLNIEVKVDASTNILYPTVVPLIIEMSSTIKELVGENDAEETASKIKVSPPQLTNADDGNILVADPSAVLGRTKLNLGLRICQQEFSLSCQPIARVAAIARFDDIYITINTVRSVDRGNFFAISAAFSRLQASVQHVYSRESTGSFEVKSIILSLMNSKHVSGKSGISAIVNISPMSVLINAKQLQDFLLFREIWVPQGIRTTSEPPTANMQSAQSNAFLVQRYQEVATTGAFPWNATVSFEELDVQTDLGQGIGKAVFVISKFWVSSRKNSDWEQNLCLGFDKIGIESTGRMSGFITLQDFRVRTSIRWAEREKALTQTPLVQGSLAFSQLRVKIAFDYQPFFITDVTSFSFVMFNIRENAAGKGDRLVATLDGDAVQVFFTTNTASQALALYQAFIRLVQEKRSNYEASLQEIERFLRRKSATPTPVMTRERSRRRIQKESSALPISLHTDVVVTLQAVNIGAYPSTFYDHQIFKLEALNAQARFSVSMDMGRIHNALGLTLGQLRIGLAAVKRPVIAKVSGEIIVEEVLESATGSRGGTILKVPKVEALMETWQKPESNMIDYLFKSSFEGKVEVGWNFSRVSYIRGMYANHTRALAQRLGKPLPPSAVKISGVPHPGEDGIVQQAGEQQKITAEVIVPQSKYEYNALQPPIIETPQLRDMGEATPPLEWIGLHRDRLPNLTHQIVIVALQEIASEVDDAYSKILGSF